ncbi:MAG: PqqD family protein [Planctomycetota bacterium]
MTHTCWTDKLLIAARHQVSAQLPGEAVILGLENNTYYGLADVGAVIWRKLQQPSSFAELESSLLAEFDVGPEQVREDLSHLLNELRAHGLIDVIPKS